MKVEQKNLLQSIREAGLCLILPALASWRLGEFQYSRTYRCEVHFYLLNPSFILPIFYRRYEDGDFLLELKIPIIACLEFHCYYSGDPDIIDDLSF